MELPSTKAGMKPVDNRAAVLVAVCYTLLPVAIVPALLRFYLRIVKGNFGKDDGCMLLGLLSFISSVTCALLGIHFGAGEHLIDLLDENRRRAIQCWWLCYLWYAVTMTSTKVSVGILMLKIVQQKSHKNFFRAGIAITAISGLVYSLLTLLQCRPVSAFWDGAEGRCLSMNVVIIISYVYGGQGIICDFAFTFLSTYVIWKLQLAKRQKILLVPIMALACVASVATVVRICYCHRAKNPDFLYETITIVIWSTVEQGLAVAAGCLATLGPLYRKIASKITSQGAQPSQLGSEDAFGGNPGGNQGASFRMTTRSTPDPDKYLNRGSEEMLTYPKDALHY
ncbi:hypothetical protein B0J13DRAFT_292033 [Dactylonectria estremocensis]|uniref:Rhodopsin domain-containing protein n=1 Tax=Dactylonectria estremocensis TaxID=1079267 RepID=A0A9P9I8J8_9HYPO|nr:hypothetical protein B0J13DRAFT_292033 [Dactylonectria estremocensis]